ncbi:MAG: hypothetical protein RLZZ26_12 [Candidatus Parcubacteria bacterium]|jgi:uncharacterized membrane protein
MQTIYLYLITLPILIVLDLAWVGGIAKNYYKGQLGAMLTDSPVWWAIGLFYLLYVAGLVYFVIVPAVGAHSLSRALLGGAFFGLIAYGTYDLTNLGLTANWPVLMSFVDMAWGAFAGGAVSALVYLIATGVFGL